MMRNDQGAVRACPEREHNKQAPHERSGHGFTAGRVRGHMEFHPMGAGPQAWPVVS
jgi:hypothetical protein